jgi:hypothetical protein
VKKCPALRHKGKDEDILVAISVPEASAFFGITTPKATPIAVVNKLNEDVNASLVDSKVIGRLAELVRHLSCRQQHLES